MKCDFCDDIAICKIWVLGLDGLVTLRVCSDDLWEVGAFGAELCFSTTDHCKRDYWGRPLGVEP